ncbi:MAG: hypothetical protein WA324_04410, partial [Bryobacteraceae bacterium]
MSALSRCLIADQPALDIVVKVGADTIFRCLTSQKVSLEDVEAIASRVRKLDTELARQLWIALMAHLQASGLKVGATRFAAVPEASLPQYASGYATGFFAAIEGWLEEDELPEYLKRKLAAILILSLPAPKGNAEKLPQTMLRLIRSLRKSKVDARMFSEKVLQDWTDRVRRLPAPAIFEIAAVLRQESDDYQKQFWDERQFGPLAETALIKQPSGSESQGNESRSKPEPPNKREEILPRPAQAGGDAILTSTQTEPFQPESPAPHPPTEGFVSAEMRSSSSPVFLKWLSEVYSQLGSILQIATDNSALKQQISDSEQRLQASDKRLQDALAELRLLENEAAEAESALLRLQQTHEEATAALASNRSRSEWFERRIVELESLKSDCDAQITNLKAELDEAPRSRILYGEQRTVELKNSLRERIGMEVAGLPSLGPELSPDNFSMLRVRFQNLLKLLREVGIIDALP